MKQVALAAAIGATLLTVGSPASAAGAAIYGTGNESCGQWLAADRDTPLYFVGESWVLGWVSAAGYYKRPAQLRVTDSDAVSAWIDKYCREHPLKGLKEAAEALVRELAATRT